MSTPTNGQVELFLDIELHPALKAKIQAGRGLISASTVTVKGELQLGEDRILRRGETITITITDEDGLVISRHEAEVLLPQLKELEDKELGVYGMLRQHPAKVTEDVNRQPHLA